MTLRNFVPFLIAASALPALCAAPPAGAARPATLRCEYRVDPVGIDVEKPRLSWVLVAAHPKERGTRQSAYQLLVATSPAALKAGEPDLWDSGKIEGDRSNQIEYDGGTLRAGMQVFWQVRVWDQNGRPSAWSAPAHWSMGLLRPEDWKAKWIGRDDTETYRDPTSPFVDLPKAKWIWGAADATGQELTFQAALTVPKSAGVIKRALCTVGSDSLFEFFVNGHSVGRGRSADTPAVFYVTEYLHQGENALTVHIAAPGGPRARGLLASARVDFDSGPALLLTTGADWTVKRGAAAPVAVTELGPYGMKPWGEAGLKEERALPARMLRKEFQIRGSIRRATAYVSGLGLSEMYLNGAKVGDAVLSPGLTDYDKRVLYVTYDVTKQLVSGHNAVGVILGNGRYWAPRTRIPTGTTTYGYPKLLLQLEIEHNDGSKETVLSDESWKLTAKGPIGRNNEYDGERYDANHELPGWDRAGFDDSNWSRAALATPPKGRLAAQNAAPLRVTESLRPKTVVEVHPGVWIFDMGQNMVGWCRLKVNGAHGTEITLRHAETLQTDGTLYLDNLRSALATDFYTLKGGGVEVWEPRFTYHGFRFVELRGFPGKPTLDTIEGRVVHDDLSESADFSTSNDLLNRIHHNAYWSVRGNYRSVPTDCPQRDERQAWLGDRTTGSRGETYLFDVAALYTKWMADMSDGEKDNGSVPDIAPPYFPFYNDNMTWPGTFIFIPEMLYDQYGDRRVIETYYPGIQKWLERMRTYVKDDLMTRDVYGDWCVPPESPELIKSKDPARLTNGVLVGTAYYHKALTTMAHYARLLDKKADAADYEAQARRVQAAFQLRFFHADRNAYDNGTQTSYLLPLAFQMVPGAQRPAVFQGLVNQIEKQTDRHIGVGLVGAQWLMRTLSDNGRADLAYAIAAQKTYPSWGYMVGKGATTTWELWNGDTADPAMNSGNHVMLIGDLGIWMYEYLAGIRPDPEKPGFKHIVIQPVPVEGLAFVKASHQSMYGRIASHWRREENRLLLDVTIPANTSATVHLPTDQGAAILESGKPAARQPGVKLVGTEGKETLVELEPGTYSFSMPGSVSSH